MRRSDRCPCEVGPVRWPTVFWLVVIVLLCTVAPALIERGAW